MGFLWSIGLIALSIYVIISSFGMTKDGWASSPGLMPLLIGVSLLGMALGLLVSSVKTKELRGLTSKVRASLADPENSLRTKRVLILVAAIAIYTLILVPLFHYIVSTFIFLVFTLTYFWWQRLLYVVALAAGVTLFFALVFTQFFETLLP